MSPVLAGLIQGMDRHPQLARWAMNMSSAVPTVLLLELLKQPVGVIARDERDVFVDAEFFQQRHELLWI